MYPRADSGTGERLVPAIRFADGDTVTYEAVTGFLLGTGPARWKLPAQIVIWDEPLPRTASGKILRDRLASDGDEELFAPRLRS